MLSRNRVLEMLDYATNYGDFDENTPDGTKPSHKNDTATPMNCLRRDAILLHKEHIKMRDALDSVYKDCVAAPQVKGGIKLHHRMWNATGKYIFKVLS